MSEMGYKKNVGLIGSISLLVTSITGPGVVLIPMVFQQGGWLIPTLFFLVIGGLSGLASLFVVESVSRFPGNEKFDRNVEFTFYGRKWYYAFLFILYGSLQSTNVASIIGSAQVFDSLFVGLFGGTCGYGIYPKSGLYCVTAISNTNSPFGDNWMLTTLGYLFVMAIIIPLTNINLNDNMFVQFVSFLYNIVFLFTLIGSAIARGISGPRVPIVGSDGSQVIGQVLYNFTLANTIPSWINVKHEKVSPKKAIWYSVMFALCLYIITGLIGGLAYDIGDSSNLLQAMYADTSLGKGTTVWITIIYLVFPILTYISSIPVNMIVARLNFLAARLLTAPQANFWSVYVPFIIGIPFQTGSWVSLFGTYTSLSFQSLCNFFAPFLIFLFLSRRKLDMAQSVLDELEFLDINAGIKKTNEADDDFDYIYHLPTANPAQILYRDPFKVVNDGKLKKDISTKNSLAALSQTSRHSIKELRSMLDPNSMNNTKLRRRRTKQNNSSFNSLNDIENNSVIERVQRKPNSFDRPDEFKQMDVGDDPFDFIPQDVISFRAMPDFVYKYINPNWIAGFGLVCMIGMVLQSCINAIQGH